MFHSISPFQDGTAPLLVHGCYHKSGTHWLRKILLKVSRRFDLEFHVASRTHESPAHGVLFDAHSRIDVEALPPHRGSHMIRDPRDIVVSAYHYHLWTEEAWAHRPQESYGGKSYQEQLDSLELEDGLILEIQRCRRLFQRMSNWNYDNPNYYEIKYEDMVAEEERVLTELFTSYGFHEQAVARAVAIGKRCGFQALSGRNLGEVETKSVMRSGRSGQWREEYTDRVKQEFKSATGDLLTHLGYELNDNW